MKYLALVTFLFLLGGCGSHNNGHRNYEYGNPRYETPYQERREHRWWNHHHRDNDDD